MELIVQPIPEEASLIAARLARIDYYRWVYDQKPEWQKL